MRHVLALTIGLGLAAHVAQAQDNTEIQLDPDYAQGEHYATVTRGGITEEIYAAAEALAAARAGQPFPYGTVITMEDHRGGTLHRTIVMEKRATWEGGTAGAWRFREFGPDGQPNMTENGSRCASCHASQEANDFVFTRDRMTN
ncbi:cytochrome P460 family protein [Donghicola mangrovi]|uniref:Cytochrome P460 family protein n=1 Tax=Donghicola mangrovi TaxID=2729614 RepID=A0A850Q958_9RHOB|nr:cytochrome P460 family protein [Donghicola mangrovi]NVO25444.1 cytochrome P460 family protein [Donghicola mangrovi]